MIFNLFRLGGDHDGHSRGNWGDPQEIFVVVVFSLGDLGPGDRAGCCRFFHWGSNGVMGGWGGVGWGLAIDLQTPLQTKVGMVQFSDVQGCLGVVSVTIEVHKGPSCEKFWDSLGSIWDRGAHVELNPPTPLQVSIPPFRKGVPMVGATP